MKYLKIGDSGEMRQLVARAISDNTSVSLILDKPRTLFEFIVKAREDEMIVQCRDIDKSERTTVILHLPYQEKAIAEAMIIVHDESKLDPSAPIES